jgi:hypothetical protein
MQEKREEFRPQFQMLGLRIALYRKKAGMTRNISQKSWPAVDCISRIEAKYGKTITGASLYMIFNIAQVLDSLPQTL